jgi:hypothetical protein
MLSLSASAITPQRRANTAALPHVGLWSRNTGSGAFASRRIATCNSPFVKERRHIAKALANQSRIDHI